MKLKLTKGDIMPASGIALVKQKIVQSYKANAWILYNIIREAQVLQQEMRQLHDVQEREKMDVRRADLNHTTTDIQTVEAIMGKAIGITKNLSLNTVEFYRRLFVELLQEVKTDRVIIQQGISQHLAAMMKATDMKDLAEFKRAMTDLGNKAIALANAVPERV
ncbi:MAG TPA: hypothetical protein VJH97_02740 [Candidatus Nanoarchaeia archaeon]|nr:hypothetical protein [Candidatus Nanoarchaeia archaeon]